MKIGIAADHEWVNAFARLFGHLFPCEFKTFKNADLEAAKNWGSGK